MTKKFVKVLCSFGILFFISNLSHAASVTGTVKWEGPVPNLKPINMSADVICAGKYKGKDPAKSQVLSLGDGNTMGNILVKVKSGLPAGKTYTAPTETLEVNQNGCMYEPHVFAVMQGQPIKFLNSDGTKHNVHALPSINRQFNITMPKTMTESAVKSFKEKECSPFRVKCDIHPWMVSYACVMDHPFFAVTKKDGTFKIDNLPAGTYELEAWHEKAGTRTASVTVTDADSKEVSFTFSKGKK
ncbi:hypothetical protein BVY03_02355 [bacterium K02(2017)]|nr:hypothetical protein BVY03_02355 [bacterium K02(2017)]